MEQAGLPFPEIDPVAFALGPLVIRWYALAYLAGFLGGWWYARRLAALAPAGPRPVDIDDFLTWAVVGVVIGGRLGFVLFYQPGYYFENPAEIAMLWRGGMAFHGGLLGVAIATLIFAWRRKLDPLALGDRLACAVPIGLFFGRLANFINNELWGRPTDLPWGVVFPIPDRLEPFFAEVPRHPSQLYEAFLEGLVLFAVLAWLARKPRFRDRPGVLSGIFLAGYGLFRTLVEFVREPDLGSPPLFGVITTGQLLSLPMLAVGIGMIVWAWRRPNPEALAPKPGPEDDGNDRPAKA